MNIGHISLGNARYSRCLKIRIRSSKLEETKIMNIIKDHPISNSECIL